MFHFVGLPTIPNPTIYCCCHLDCDTAVSFEEKIPIIYFFKSLFFYNSIHRDHLQSSPQEHHRGQILVRYQRLFILWFTLLNCLRTNSSILIFQTRSGAWDWLFPPHRKYLNGSVVLMKGKAKDKIIGSFLSSYGTVIASAMAS